VLPSFRPRGACGSMLHPAGQRYSRSRAMQRQAAIESRGFEQPLQVAAAVRHPVSSFLPRGDLVESAPLRFRLHCGNNDSAWPGDGPAMLMISLPSPATEPASSVTSEWRLSCRIPSPRLPCGPCRSFGFGNVREYRWPYWLPSAAPAQRGRTWRDVWRLWCGARLWGQT